MLKYRHKKTGRIYLWLAAGTDCTNSRNWLDREVAIYCPDDDQHTIYVRERAEFEEKFEMVAE